MNLNAIAAPLLKARSIQLAHIDCVWTEDQGTVYTITDETGKMGTFSIPTQELAKAVETQTVPDLLTPYIQSVEFADVKPAVPEVQPVTERKKTGRRKPKVDKGTSTPDLAAVPSETDARDSGTTPETEGEEPDAGQDTVQVGE